MVNKTDNRALLPAETEIGELYTPKEVAQLLKVTLRTVQTWIGTGQLRATRYGRVWRIRAADVHAFGRENRNT
jgi:excisionase family DNA binding protein